MKSSRCTRVKCNDHTTISMQGDWLRLATPLRKSSNAPYESMRVHESTASYPFFIRKW